MGPSGEPSGRIEGGSEEFAALTGSYQEHWQITGIDDSGVLSGTIELSTTSYLAQ